MLKKNNKKGIEKSKSKELLTDHSLESLHERDIKSFNKGSLLDT